MPSGPPGSLPPARSLKARAVGLLARREHSRAELTEKLVATGASRAEADAVVADLSAKGLLSDTRFAYAVVRQKSGTHSRRAISETLKARGVTGDAAAEALAAHGVDDEAALSALWRRRFGVAPAGEREKARQVRFLQSRGFSLSAILRFLRDPPAE